VKEEGSISLSPSSACLVVCVRDSVDLRYSVIIMYASGGSCVDIVIRMFRVTSTPTIAVAVVGQLLLNMET